MATHYYDQGAFKSDDFLLLPCITHWEQSILLPDGTVLMASVDPSACAFVLTRHLKHGALDEAFGDRGVQRIASEVAASVTHLSLELEADGSLTLEGTVDDRSSMRGGSCRLRVLPTTAAVVHLGEDAFLSLARSPLASELLLGSPSPWPSSVGQ